MKPLVFGDYELQERISHGGMAEVYRAVTYGAAGFERTVAIKLLLPTIAMDENFVVMLIDEAKIAGSLNHANIAQIFDLGKFEDRYYIVQEFVNGKDIRSMQKAKPEKNRLFDIRQSVHLAIKVCEALEYAHNKRDAEGRLVDLVHRDISPQNVMVSREGEVKLVDFGIAKAEGRSTRTLAGLVKGKFAYMSPEQLRGLPVDRRSDVFACGIVLWEMLTGKALFRRASEYETLKQARNGEIEPPSFYNPNISPKLEETVMRALQRHVDDRFQTAADFRDALWAAAKADNGFYTRNELAAWMRDHFPEETGHEWDTSLESGIDTLSDVNQAADDLLDSTFFDPTLGQQMERQAAAMSTRDVTFPSAESPHTERITAELLKTVKPVSLMNAAVSGEVYSQTVDSDTLPSGELIAKDFDIPAPERRTALANSVAPPAALHESATVEKAAANPAILFGANDAAKRIGAESHEQAPYTSGPMGSGQFPPGDAAWALVRDLPSDYATQSASSAISTDNTAQINWAKLQKSYSVVNHYTLSAFFVLIASGLTSILLVLL